MIKYQQLQDESWLRERVNSQPLRHIAKEVGCSYSAVVHTTRKFGIRVPHRTKHRYNPNKSAAVIAGLKKRYPHGRFGQQASNWRGGISPKHHNIRTSERYKAWRRAVFERDQYTCQSCGKHGGDLEADHIKPFAFFPELRLSLENGQTLCKPCHRLTPTHSKHSMI